MYIYICIFTCVALHVYCMYIIINLCIYIYIYVCQCMMNIYIYIYTTCMNSIWYVVLHVRMLAITWQI